MWAKGLWNRLNGSPGQPLDKDAPFGLPLPVGTEEQRKQHMQQLNVQLDALEKKLQVRLLVLSSFFGIEVALRLR